MLFIETDGKIVRNLSASGNDDTHRRLHFDDIHHSLKGEFIKIEAVTHIIVG